MCGGVISRYCAAIGKVLNADQDPHRKLSGVELEEAQRKERLKLQRDFFGIKEASFVLFWKQVCAEYLAAFIYTMCNLMIYMDMHPLHATVVCVYEVCFSNGFIMGGIVMFLGPLSGGYVNPALDVGMWVAGRIKFVKFILYVIVHIVGSYSGGYLIWMLLKDIEGFDVHNWGTLSLKPEIFFLVGHEIREATCLKVEAMMMFALTLVYAGGEMFYVTGRINATAHTALGVFACVTAAHFTCLAITGCAMNPARMFTSAYLSNSTEKNFMYYVGPLSGALVGGLLHKNGLELHRIDYSIYK